MKYIFPFISTGKSIFRCRFHAWWFHGYNNAFAHAGHRGEYGRRSVGLGGNIGKSLRSMAVGVKPSPRYEVKIAQIAYIKGNLN